MTKHLPTIPTEVAKDAIEEYFSDRLQNDETPVGAMQRNQLRKLLLDFAQQFEEEGSDE